MRVTNDMITRQVLNDINSNLSKVQKYQQQISSGKRIESPSDDPQGMSLALSFRSDQASLEQYRDNIASATDWLNTTTEKLSSVEDIIIDVLDIAQQGINGLLDSDAKTNLAQQVDQYLQELIDIANSKQGDRAIFGGTQTLTDPFSGVDLDVDGDIDRVNSNPNGISGDIEREIGKGQTMVINSKGDEVFQPGGVVGGDDDLFGVLISLRDDLESGASSDDIQAHIDNLNTILSRVTNENAVVGAKINRLELRDAMLESEIYNATSNISDIEDADYTETIMEYQNQQNMLTASLKIGAQIINMSLVDFLS